MRFNDAFHFSRSTKREKTMRHRVVSKDNRTGSKVLLLLRETNEAMETSSSRKRFALPPLSPLFSSISGFPGSCLPSPLPEQIHEFFHFLTIHRTTNRRVSKFFVVAKEPNEKESFLVARCIRRCDENLALSRAVEPRRVRTFVARYSSRYLLRHSLL